MLCLSSKKSFDKSPLRLSLRLSVFAVLENRLQNFFSVDFKLFPTLLHLKHNKPKIAPLRG